MWNDSQHIYTASGCCSESWLSMRYIRTVVRGFIMRKHERNQTDGLVHFPCSSNMAKIQNTTKTVVVWITKHLWNHWKTLKTSFYKIHNICTLIHYHLAFIHFELKVILREMSGRQNSDFTQKWYHMFGLATHCFHHLTTIF